MLQRLWTDKNGRLALIAVVLLGIALVVMIMVLLGEIARTNTAADKVMVTANVQSNTTVPTLPPTNTILASLSSASDGTSTPSPTPTLEPYVHVVQPGETGLDILLQYGYRSLDVVGEIMYLNNLKSFNDLQAGTTLLIPRQTPTPIPDEGAVVADLPTPTTAPTLPAPSVDTDTLPPATAASTETATPDAVAEGRLEASIDSPTYLADGRWAEVMITVRNISVEPTIQTGFTYVTPNPDGGTRYVTLLDVIHQEVPQAVIGDAPLWIGTVKFSDDKVFEFPAGCFYVETVEAHGWEPIGGEGGFHWNVHWTGGFFDCGNSTHKIPPPIGPGQTATIPMYVYMQHPRLWLDYPPPDRRILRIEMRMVDGLGNPLGIVAVRSWE